MRAVRGATTVKSDERGAVLSATRQMLKSIMRQNQFSRKEVISALFTTTPDLTCCFPAEAAREIGWTDEALMCASEIAVPGALPRCVRVLIHVDAAMPKEEIQHVYLRGAAALRPDLTREVT